MNNFSPLTAIIVAGLVAGTIDIGAAALINERDPMFISQVIAGGLLGKASFAGGMKTVALGIVLQWAMSMLIAAVFVVASGWWPALRQNWWLAGIAYGVPVYFTMEYVVVPLSAWHRWPKFAAVPFAENMAAMMVFGLIVAFFASRIES
jgi:uncharacterized membrane protein YagU involved in acid resistance